MKSLLWLSSLGPGPQRGNVSWLSARLELVWWPILANAFPTTMYCRYCRIFSHVIFHFIYGSLKYWQVPKLYMVFLYVCLFTCVCSLGWVQGADFRNQNSVVFSCLQLSSVVLAFCGMIEHRWNIAEWSLTLIGSKAEAERDIGAVSRLSRRKSGRQERAHCLQAQRTLTVTSTSPGPMRAQPKRATNDPRFTQKGRASAWLIKARSDGSNAKWFQTMGRRCLDVVCVCLWIFVLLFDVNFLVCFVY